MLLKQSQPKYKNLWVQFWVQLGHSISLPSVTNIKTSCWLWSIKLIHCPSGKMFLKRTSKHRKLTCLVHWSEVATTNSILCSAVHFMIVGFISIYPVITVGRFCPIDIFESKNYLCLVAETVLFFSKLVRWGWPHFSWMMNGKETENGNERLFRSLWSLWRWPQSSLVDQISNKI